MTRKRVLIVAGLVVLVLAILATVAAKQASPWLRDKIVADLGDRLDSEVTLESVELSLFPQPTLSGHNLTIRYQGRTDIPPFIVVRQFEGSTDLLGAFQRRAREVRLEGLEISVPPRRGDDMPDVDTGRDDADQGGDRDTHTWIDHLVTKDARLSILSKDPGKNPKVFDIFTLEMHDVGLESPAPFEATVTNPIPFGNVQTKGHFGPWQRAEPSLTPLDGEFTFDADLGTIKGIAGALDAAGSFGGVLERIEARGSTTTPDFALPSLPAGKVPLETRFDAVIDGTSGDVFLTSVDARLGGSAFTTSGAIAGVEGGKGKRVTLDVKGQSARIDDFLRLTVDGENPPLIGPMRFNARVDIRPGDEDVVDKLWVTGDFALEDARFSSPEVQDKIDALSRRGQGRPEDESVDNVVSDMKGEYSLKDGRMTIPIVTFGVTGADVQMAGVYGLRDGTLDFKGDVRLDAPVSKMVTGFKSWLLKPFDPLFRKHGAGTRVAIKVEGTKDNPEFGVEIGRTLTGK
ncbi:MAG: AsmA-like C-terminal region-containing protein [Vicinamibacterales bacterium]